MAPRATRLKDDEEGRLVGQVGVGEDAEGRPAVAHVAEAQQAAHELAVLVELEAPADQPFGELVGPTTKAESSA